jgi:ATP-dependent HslUV protease ATP-binding subunit HslU
MSHPVDDLTPRQIVAELDQYIVGQDAAKRAVAVALRNRYRRQQLPPDQRDDVLPKNILMIGPTGVGKTEIARRLAQIARAPFIKVEATKFTEVGYVGRDVESMVRDLAGVAVRLVEKERLEEVRPQAAQFAEERLLDLLVEAMPHRYVPTSATPEQLASFHAGFGAFGHLPYTEATPEQQELFDRRRRRIELLLRHGRLDGRYIEVDTEEQGTGFLQVFTPGGMEEMGLDNLPGGLGGGTRRVRRRATVREAREVLLQDEAKRMIDQAGVRHEALSRAEQMGIIFIDELDKVAIKSSGGSGPDVSREGVQRDLLPIIEGSTVQTKFGPLRTDHILFIAAGAFHIAKPSDLIPELQGRLPIRVRLETLNLSDFKRILREPKNALVKQYQMLLKADGVDLRISEDALDEIASIAASLNERLLNIGARRLHTVMEKLLEDVLFRAPDPELKSIVFSQAMVREILDTRMKGRPDSEYIL